MKRKLMNTKKKVAVGVAVATAYMLQTIPVLANTPSIQDLPFFTGTMNLAQTVTGGLTLLAGGIGAGFATKDGIAWHSAQPEDKPAKLKTFKGTCASAVVITCIPGILTWVLGFYQ